jgi:hypothetical protein
LAGNVSVRSKTASHVGLSFSSDALCNDHFKLPIVAVPPRKPERCAKSVTRKPYFAGSSLILSPPFATGMTQIGVATSAELRSDV